MDPTGWRGSGGVENSLQGPSWKPQDGGSYEDRSTRRATGRLLYIAPALLLALAQLPLVAQQSPAQVEGSGSANWADEVLKTEGYVTPPKELADAVLIPRYLNVSLTSASPDKKWFLNEIGDGPVLMKTFSKPYPRARRRLHRLQARTAPAR